MPAKVKTPAIPLVWLTVLLFALVEFVLWWMYHHKTFDRESISFLATIAGGAFALFAYLKGVEEKQVDAAGKYIQRWNDPSFRPIVDNTRQIVDGLRDSATLARPLFDWNTADLKDRKLRDDMVTILNFSRRLPSRSKKRKRMRTG